jgi:hypothetical protein
MKMMTLAKLLAALCVLNSVVPVACAAVSGQDAEQLKTTLTPLGAEKAGNKDGSIPAWTGGYTTVPANHKPGDRRFDPFAADKPLYRITAENMSQYADKLSDSVKALLKKYPATFRLDVYQTRRTAAGPQWVYDNTFKNATHAKLENDGLSVTGAFGGVPFPIPKTGEEVRWNHLTRWRGEAIASRYKVWSMTASGQRVMATDAVTTDQYPYYKKGGSVTTNPDAEFFLSIQSTTAPAFRAGEALLVRDVVDVTKGTKIWQYLAGQRRVRRAQNIAFDTPDFVASGTSFADETFGGFGSPERYNYKLIGKKELYIPYNTNKLFMVKDEEAMDAGHLKPDQVRWELHRVWVVEATLKEGKRHAVPKRISYYDEDTWGTAIMDGWDPKGQLWRTSLMLPFVAPDLPAVVNYCTDMFFNLQTGAWVYHCSMGTDSDAQYKATSFRPDSFFTPDALSNQGTR